MSTPYTGNPTGVQAPSGAPAVNTAPTVSITVDGDPVNAAEFNQGYKVAADNIAFLQQIAGGARSAKTMVVDGVGGALSSAPDGVTLTRGLAVGTSAATTSITLNSTSPVVVLADTTSGAFVINLPVAAASPVSLVFIIKDVGGLAGTNNITVSRQVPDTIDGATTSKIINSNYGVLRIVRTGANSWGLI